MFMWRNPMYLLRCLTPKTDQGLSAANRPPSDLDTPTVVSAPVKPASPALSREKAPSN